MTWQPIETAPKDGTPVMVFSPSLGCVLAVFGGTPEDNWISEWKSDWDHNRLATPPTHWMPLPEAPK